MPVQVREFYTSRAHVEINMRNRIFDLSSMYESDMVRHSFSVSYSDVWDRLIKLYV